MYFVWQMADFTTSSASEDDKIKAMISMSSTEFDASRFLKRPCVGPPPTSYVCFKCMKPGHWIHKCPNAATDKTCPRVEVKRSTGIPRSFMMAVDDPTHKGVMLSTSGELVIPVLDAKAYQERKIEKPPFVPEAEEGSDKNKQGSGDSSSGDATGLRSGSSNTANIPEDLQCSLCRELLCDAVLTPCCGACFCDECIRQALLDSDHHECPACHELDQTPDKLIPNRFLRNKVARLKGRLDTQQSRGTSRITSTKTVEGLPASLLNTASNSVLRAESPLARNAAIATAGCGQESAAIDRACASSANSSSTIMQGEPIKSLADNGAHVPTAGAASESTKENQSLDAVATDTVTSLAVAVAADNSNLAKLESQQETGSSVGRLSESERGEPCNSSTKGTTTDDITATENGANEEPSSASDKKLADEETKEIDMKPDHQERADNEGPREKDREGSESSGANALSEISEKSEIASGSSSHRSQKSPPVEGHCASPVTSQRHRHHLDLHPAESAHYRGREAAVDRSDNRWPAAGHHWQRDDSRARCTADYEHRGLYERESRRRYDRTPPRYRRAYRDYSPPVPPRWAGSRSGGATRSEAGQPGSSCDREKKPLTGADGVSLSHAATYQPLNPPPMPFAAPQFGLAPPGFPPGHPPPPGTTPPSSTTATSAQLPHAQPPPPGLGPPPMMPPGLLAPFPPPLGLLSVSLPTGTAGSLCSIGVSSNQAQKEALEEFERKLSEIRNGRRRRSPSPLSSGGGRDHHLHREVIGGLHRHHRRYSSRSRSRSFSPRERSTSPLLRRRSSSRGRARSPLVSHHRGGGGSSSGYVSRHERSDRRQRSPGGSRSPLYLESARYRSPSRDRYVSGASRPGQFSPRSPEYRQSIYHTTSGRRCASPQRSPLRKRSPADLRAFDSPSASLQQRYRDRSLERSSSPRLGRMRSRSPHGTSRSPLSSNKLRLPSESVHHRRAHGRSLSPPVDEGKLKTSAESGGVRSPAGDFVGEKKKKKKKKTSDDDGDRSERRRRHRSHEKSSEKHEKSSKKKKHKRKKGKDAPEDADVQSTSPPSKKKVDPHTEETCDKKQRKHRRKASSDEVPEISQAELQDKSLDADDVAEHDEDREESAEEPVVAKIEDAIDDTSVLLSTTLSDDAGVTAARGDVEPEDASSLRVSAIGESSIPVSESVEKNSSSPTHGESRTDQVQVDEYRANQLAVASHVSRPGKNRKSPKQTSSERTRSPQQESNKMDRCGRPSSSHQKLSSPERPFIEKSKWERSSSSEREQSPVSVANCPENKPKITSEVIHKAEEVLMSKPLRIQPPPSQTHLPSKVISLKAIKSRLGEQPGRDARTAIGSGLSGDARDASHTEAASEIQVTIHNDKPKRKPILAPSPSPVREAGGVSYGKADNNCTSSRVVKKRPDDFRDIESVSSSSQLCGSSRRNDEPTSGRSAASMLQPSGRRDDGRRRDDRKHYSHRSPVERRRSRSRERDLTMARLERDRLEREQRDREFARERERELLRERDRERERERRDRSRSRERRERDRARLREREELLREERRKREELERELMRQKKLEEEIDRERRKREQLERELEEARQRGRRRQESREGIRGSRNDSSWRSPRDTSGFSHNRNEALEKVFSDDRTSRKRLRSESSNSGRVECESLNTPPDDKGQSSSKGAKDTRDSARKNSPQARENSSVTPSHVSAEKNGSVQSFGNGKQHAPAGNNNSDTKAPTDSSAALPNRNSELPNQQFCSTGDLDLSFEPDYDLDIEANLAPNDTEDKKAPSVLLTTAEDVTEKIDAGGDQGRSEAHHKPATGSVSALDKNISPRTVTRDSSSPHRDRSRTSSSSGEDGSEDGDRRKKKHRSGSSKRHKKHKHKKSKKSKKHTK